MVQNKFETKSCNALLFFLILFFPSVVLFHHLQQLWVYTVDDAYISFRYADHFFESGKILWNISDPPIEGYTSFLHILILTIGFFLPLSILIWSKSVGIFSAITAGFFILWKCLKENNQWLTLSMALFFSVWLLDINTAIHAVAGLETTLYFLLLLMLCVSFADANNNLKFFSFLALLVGFTRPEGNLYVIIFFLVSFFYASYLQRKIFLKNFLMIYLIPAIIYFVWRIYYYQHLLPLPFYIKMGGVSQAFPGFEALKEFFRYYWPLLLYGIFSFAVCARYNKRSFAGYFLVLLAGFLFILNINPVMNYAYRFIWPFLAILLALNFQLKFAPKKLQIAMVILLTVLSIIFIFKNLAQAQNLKVASLEYAQGLSHAHIPLGQGLNSISHSERYLVTCDAGAISFYSDWNVIDSCGLNNNILATKKLNDAQKVNYIFSNNPQVVVVIDNIPYQKMIYNEAIREGMREVKRYQFLPNYYLIVLSNLPEVREKLND